MDYYSAAIKVLESAHGSLSTKEVTERALSMGLISPAARPLMPLCRLSYIVMQASMTSSLELLLKDAPVQYVEVSDGRSGALLRCGLTAPLAARVVANSTTLGRVLSRVELARSRSDALGALDGFRATRTMADRQQSPPAHLKPQATQGGLDFFVSRQPADRG